jgi:hypothetical protein
MAEKYA